MTGRFRTLVRLRWEAQEVTPAQLELPGAMPESCLRGIEMPKRTCSVPGCDKATSSHGLCQTHVGRWRRRVAAGLPHEPADLVESRNRRAETCRVEGCDRPPSPGKSLCSMHRSRLERWGVLEDESRSIKYAPAIDRFVRRFEPQPNGCWIWTGACFQDGYGAFSPVGTGRNVRVHRWAYERFVGRIPDGLVIDHLCHVPQCVNPDHLEAVTAQENTRRWVAIGSPYGSNKRNRKRKTA